MKHERHLLSEACSIQQNLTLNSYEQGQGVLGPLEGGGCMTTRVDQMRI